MKDTYITLESFRLALSQQQECTDWYSEVPVHEFQFDSRAGNELTMTFGRGITVEVPSVRFDSRALEGILERLQVEGKGFRKLKAEVLAPTLNNFSAVAKGDAEIAIRDGKVFACLSSGATKNDFRHLNSTDVLDKTEMSIHMNWGVEESFSGVLEDKYLQAAFLLPEKEFSGNTYFVRLCFNTSDYGRSAIHYRADLVERSGAIIPVFEQDITHRSGNTLDRIDETISMLEKSIDDGTIRLEAMKSIVINNPVGCMKRIGSKFKLPKKEVLPEIIRVEKLGNKPDTAEQCYRTLVRGILVYESKASLAYSRQYISKVLSLIGCDWEEYDLPGTFNW